MCGLNKYKHLLSTGYLETLQHTETAWGVGSSVCEAKKAPEESKQQCQVLTEQPLERSGPCSGQRSCQCLPVLLLTAFTHISFWVVPRVSLWAFPWDQHHAGRAGRAPPASWTLLLFLLSINAQSPSPPLHSSQQWRERAPREFSCRTELGMISVTLIALLNMQGLNHI